MCLDSPQRLAGIELRLCLARQPFFRDGAVRASEGILEAYRLCPTLGEGTAAGGQIDFERLSSRYLYEVIRIP